MITNWILQEFRRPEIRRHTRDTLRTEPRRQRISKVPTIGIAASVFILAAAAFIPAASAAQKVQLGTATPFAVLGASEVTDVPTSSITGDVGLSPASGTFYAGLTKSEVNGTIYTTDGTGPTPNVNDPALLTQAQDDLTTAFVTTQHDTPTSRFGVANNQLGGRTLVPGVYAFGHAPTANLTAAKPLVLNGEGNVNAVFVFQASSDLVMASNSVVQLENGAQACNVFWTVGSSATLKSSSTFVGTIMALTSATLGSGVTVDGRVLVQNGAVTLIADTISAPSTCVTSSPTTTTTTSPTTTTTSPTTTTTTSPTTTTTSPTTTTTTSPTTTTTTTSPTTTTTTAAPVTTATTTPQGGSSGSTGTGGGGGSGIITTTNGTTTGGEATTGTGGAAGVASSTVVPAGFPHTGFGGAAHSRSDDLIYLGAFTMLGSVGMLAVSVRRRRALGALAE